MIVKQVAEALRRQDWAAVAVEFVLVVVGVLLAFQISEWATEREARVERNAATARLLEEAEQTVAYMRLGVTSQRMLVDDLNLALSRLASGSWQQAEEERMTRGLAQATFSAPPAPPSSVYDDIVSSGMLGRIGDTKLRATIADFRATLSINQQVANSFGARMPELQQHPALKYQFSATGPQRVRLSVDFPALARDGTLQESLAILAERQRQTLLVRERTLKRAQKMCRQLGTAVGRPCDLNRPPPSFD